MSATKRYQKVIAPALVAELDKYKHLAVHYEELYKTANHLYEHFKTQFAPGHFYSPYPDLEELRHRKNVVFNRAKTKLAGVDLRESEQLKLLHKFRDLYSEFPYNGPSSKSKLRYTLDHHAYAHTDAFFLFCFLRYFQPKRVIEIGSGYSSALMLDTNEIFFDSKIDLTFIEPYPELLRSMTLKDDAKKYKLIPKPLHQIDKEIFSSLGAGDILFIDSTHVAKAGGDVNQIYFEVLPALKSGVIIHIHDIFYPFEYPSDWVWETRAWNEIYIVRAFLYNNSSYEVLLFNNFLNLHHKADLKKYFPLTIKNDGGSLWLRKVK